MFDVFFLSVFDFFNLLFGFMVIGGVVVRGEFLFMFLDGWVIVGDGFVNGGVIGVVFLMFEVFFLLFFLDILCCVEEVVVMIGWGLVWDVGDCWVVSFGLGVEVGVGVEDGDGGIMVVGLEGVVLLI